MVSRAPDITERTIIDLSGRLSTFYDLNANAFDIAVAGLPFIMAVTDNTPYKRQTAEFRAQRVDQMRDPGEHTLAGSGYWTRSQSSWHYGEGINFTEPLEGNDMEVRFRYKDSYGVDVWTPGQLSLLKKTTLVQAFRGKSKIDTGANTSGVDFLIATDLEPVVTTTSSATAASGVTTISVASTANIVAGYVISATGITSGTTVSTVGTSSVTLSAATTASIASGSTLTFNPVNAIYKINTSQTSSALVTYASLGNSTILATTSDGSYLYVATTTGIYDVDMVTGTASKSYAYDTALVAASAVLKYVKSRVVAAGKFTNGTYAAYELLFPAKGAGAATVIKPTMTAANGTLIDGSVNMPTGWVWNSITEARNAIYLGGYSGDHSTIFKLQVSTAGVLGTIVTTSVLPRGEVIKSLYSYLGTYVMMGTSKGARIATSDTNGDLTYGPIAYHNESGVNDFEARDSYVWCTATNGVNSNAGTYRINIAQPITLSGYAQPISTGVYARAADLFADGVTGTVNSVRIYSTNIVAFSVDDSGVWIQHPTDLVESGVLNHGRIRFDTMENKAWKRARVRTLNDTATGDIALYKINPTGTTIIKTFLEGSDTVADIDLQNAYPTIAQDAAFRLQLTRTTTSATTGPIVVGLAIKALPTPTRARIIQIPLFCYDRETDKTGNIIGYEGYAKERLLALETVEAMGETIIVQDFNAGGDPIECVIEQVTFTRSTPANRNYSGFGGIVQLVARTVV